MPSGKSRHSMECLGSYSSDCTIHASYRCIISKNNGLVQTESHSPFNCAAFPLMKPDTLLGIVLKTIHATSHRKEKARPGATLHHKFFMSLQFLILQTMTTLLSSTRLPAAVVKLGIELPALENTKFTVILGTKALHSILQTTAWTHLLDTPSDARYCWWQGIKPWWGYLPDHL